MEANSITNCGLLALKNANDLKNISVRTLINVAEDNGLLLYAYDVPLDELKDIEFPLIVHTNDHFQYALSCNDFNNAEYTGVVLSFKKIDKDGISPTLLKEITGGTWAAAGVASAQLTLSAYELYEANKQKKKAEQLEKENEANRPTYHTPQEIENYLSDAQRMAAQGMPEAQRQRYLDQIARNSAYAISGNIDRGSGLQGVSRANMAMNDANANLLVMDSQQRQQNINNLQGARLAYAGYKDKEFAYNEDAPYQSMAASIRALKGAAAANKDTALNNAMQGAQTGASADWGSLGSKKEPPKSTSTPYLTSTPNTVPNQQDWQNANPNNYYVNPYGAPNTQYGYGVPYETQTVSSPTVGGGDELTTSERQKLIKLLGNP